MAISCSNPATPPSYNLTFPDTQVIPSSEIKSNPFYDFTANKSYWTYIIDIDSSSELNDLSYWVLQICPEITVEELSVEVSTDGGDSFIPVLDIEVLGVDPPTGVFSVLKINRPQNRGTTNIYRIEINSPTFYDLAAQSGTIAIAAGTLNFFFVATTCPESFPTPSIRCQQIAPTRPLTLTKSCPKPPASFFTIGDTVTISLEVTNPNDLPVNNVTVVDKIDVPVGVTIGALTPVPTAFVNPLLPPYTNTDITVTWTLASVLPGVTPLSVSFPILDAPTTETVITNVDAGIDKLSGTDEFECFIPVINEAKPTNLNCSIQLCTVIKSKRTSQLLVPSYGFCIPPPCTALPGVCPPSPPPQCDVPLSTGDADSLQQPNTEATFSCFEKSIQSDSEIHKVQEDAKVSQVQPGLCPPEGCPPPTRIECIKVDKLYDSCFQIDNIDRTITVFFADLTPGEVIKCELICDPVCSVIERTPLPDGLTKVMLKISIPLAQQSPNDDCVNCTRIIELFKTIALCAPEGTKIDCSETTVLSCICVVSS